MSMYCADERIAPHKPLDMRRCIIVTATVRFRMYCVAGPVLSTLLTVTHRGLTQLLRQVLSFIISILEMGNPAQRSQETCSGSHSLSVVVPSLEISSRECPSNYSLA